MEDLNRRNLLCGLGGLAVGGTLASLVPSANAAEAPKIEAPAGRFQQVGGDFGWPKQKLDPKEVAPICYDAYWHKEYACSYACFYGIIGVMGEKFGAPYNQFPFTMFEAFKGGISDYGTICGALAGAASAFALFWGRKERNAMVYELFRWYEQTALPIYNPGDAAQGFKGDLPTSVSESVLCHISVSKWCYANKIGAKSKQRSERCGRLSVDVCMKAIEIMNAKIDAGDKFKGAFAKQESVVQCGACHQQKGGESDWAKGVLNCTPCHNGSTHLGNKFENHPSGK